MDTLLFDNLETFSVKLSEPITNIVQKHEPGGATVRLAAGLQEPRVHDFHRGDDVSPLLALQRRTRYRQGNYSYVAMNDDK